MVDEIKKTIRTDLVINADQAVQDARKLREAVEQVKAQLRDLGASSQESLKVVSESFKMNLGKETLDPLRQQIKDLKAEIKAFESSEFGAALGNVGLTDESKEKLLALESEYKRITTSVTIAQQELQKEFTKNAQAAQKSFGDASTAAAAFRTQVNAAKIELQQLVASGKSLDDAFQGLKTTGRFEANALSQALKEVKQETKEAAKATDEYSKSTFDLGNVAQRVFRSIIGFIVLNVLRQLLGLYNDVTRAGKEFADSMLEISSAVQSLQRSGIDVTMAEVADEVTRLGEKFQVFTTRDLNSGLAALFDIGRQLGLTKDQMFALADATAFLAQKNNKEFTPSINQVTTALVNGQTRGLKGLDLAISEQQIKEEAYRLELAKVGEQLDANTKAQALYSLILQEAARQSGSLAEIEGLLAIQYKSEESTLQDLKDAIGTQLLPSKIALYKVVNSLIGIFAKFINFQREVSITVLTALGYVFVFLGQTIKAFGDNLRGVDTNIEDVITNTKRIVSEFNQFISDFAAPAGERNDLGLSDLVDGIDQANNDLEGAGDSLNDTLEDLYIKLRESIINGNQDIAKENRKFFDDLEEDFLRYQQKLKELADKFAFDRAKIERDYANKVASINQKYRDRELDNEQKFQDKLRSLRAKFLFDLEDALAERDARQIIRLIRQFRLNQDELKRQRDTERRDIEEERQRELHDLQLQRDQRLNELNLEYQFRRQKLAEEFAFERKLAQMDHEQRLREIQIQTKERNEELIRRYSDEYAITDTFAKAIRDRLNAEFGPNGQIEAIYNYFIEMTENTFEYLNEVLKHLNRIPGQLRKATDQTSGSVPSYGGGYAEGGTLVANKPTLALFGEGGPERVDFSPLTRPGANVGRVFGGTLPASLMEEKLLSIMISLSPGLEAEIIEKSLGQMADVIIDTNRQRL